jgi:hypothetical protein
MRDSREQTPQSNKERKAKSSRPQSAQGEIETGTKGNRRAMSSEHHKVNKER